MIPDRQPLSEEIERRQNEQWDRRERHAMIYERFMPAYTGPCGGDVCDNPEIEVGDSCPKCVHTRRR